MPSFTFAWHSTGAAKALRVACIVSTAPVLVHRRVQAHPVTVTQKAPYILQVLASATHKQARV